MCYYKAFSEKLKYFSTMLPPDDQYCTWENIEGEANVAHLPKISLLIQ